MFTVAIDCISDLYLRLNWRKFQLVLLSVWSICICRIDTTCFPFRAISSYRIENAYSVAFPSLHCIFVECPQWRCCRRCLVELSVMRLDIVELSGYQWLFCYYLLLLWLWLISAHHGDYCRFGAFYTDCE